MAGEKSTASPRKYGWRTLHVPLTDELYDAVKAAAEADDRKPGTQGRLLIEKGLGRKPKKRLAKAS